MKAHQLDAGRSTGPGTLLADQGHRVCHYNREDARKRAVSATYAQSRDPLAVERLKAHWAVYGHPCEDVRIAS